MLRRCPLPPTRPPRVAALLATAAALAALGQGCARDAATETTGLESPRPVPTPDRRAFVAAVDALAANALQRGPVAGLSVAVFERGVPVLAKGYGFADLEAGVPATAETSYPIASVTKPFTAALILRLADQGRLGLDDPLSRFFPAARARIGALTLRHLLEHTSGLSRGGPSPKAAARKVITRGGTARDQGSAWTYSNYNFSLLGLVIEQVTGRDFAAHVQHELALPLGLTGTGYCEDGTAVPGRARDYLSTRNRVTPTDYWKSARFFAAGGLCSTVLDLVRWERALEDGKVLSPAMLRAMRTPARLPGLLEADYGLGTRMGRTGSRRKVGHTGGGQGNKAVLARYPDDDVTIAVLLNTERASAVVTANDLEETVARLFFGLPGAGASPPAPSALAEDLQRYAGDYRHGSRFVRITADTGALTLRPGLRYRRESRFLPMGDGLFMTPDDPSVALRFQVQDDAAGGYAAYRNGWFAGLAVRSLLPAPLPSRVSMPRARKGGSGSPPVAGPAIAIPAAPAAEPALPGSVVPEEADAENVDAAPELEE